MKTENQKLNIALWRFSLISPLLHRDAGTLSFGTLLSQAAERAYVHPDGSYVQLSTETLRKWMYRYRHLGLPGLEAKTRADSGWQHVSEAVASKMFALRSEHPRWTVARIIKELAEKGIWNGRKPSRSAIYRFAKDHNLRRDPHLHSESARAFAFEQFGQLWSADFLHGPKLYSGRKKKKTYLHVIIDDSSRYIVHGGFYLFESVESLLYDLMASVERFGLPQRFYVDNGAAYASRHLKIICAKNGIDLVHTPPYRPQGRGKVERFFRTVREQFLCDKYKTVEQINKAFQKWLITYQESIHSSLKCSPIQKRMASGSVCRQLPPNIDVESLFWMEKRCRVYKDSTIRFKKRKLEVPGCLPGSRVIIYYMPWDLEQIYYGDEMKKARMLDLAANAKRFENPGQ